MSKWTVFNVPSHMNAVSTPWKLYCILTLAIQYKKKTIGHFFNLPWQAWQTSKSPKLVFVASSWDLGHQLARTSECSKSRFRHLLYTYFEATEQNDLYKLYVQNYWRYVKTNKNSHCDYIYTNGVVKEIKLNSS